MDFFQDLWSSNSIWDALDILKALPHDHTTLLEEDKAFLTKLVPYKEIFSTTKSIAKGKSLGPDGSNVEFYLFY